MPEPLTVTCLSVVIKIEASPALGVMEEATHKSFAELAIAFALIVYILRKVWDHATIFIIPA